jgi:hypothetical protein
LDGNLEGTKYYTLSKKCRENFLKQIENVDFKENVISDDEEIPEKNEEKLCYKFIMFKVIVIFKIIWIHLLKIERVAVFSYTRVNKYILSFLCASFLRIIKDFLL